MTLTTRVDMTQRAFIHGHAFKSDKARTQVVKVQMTDRTAEDLHVLVVLHRQVVVHRQEFTRLERLTA